MHPKNLRQKRTVRVASALLVVLALLIAGNIGGSGGANAQAPSSSVIKMRTRLLTSLTGYEVADYLKRSDVIFVPVGPTEVNGGNPTDVEYVIPLAYALKLAEKSDGLVLPYLSYFYPGSTTISPGTVMVTPEEGILYLKTVTRSLIRQGFKRVIFLTSHGPSGDTLGPLVREIFDQDHVPVVWMSTSVIESGGRERSGVGRPAVPAMPTTPAGMAAAMDSRHYVTYGSYQIVGRLEDMPINFSVPKHEFEDDKGMAALSRHLVPGQSDVGRFYSDPSEHGGWPTAVTAEQRAEWGKKGEALIESQVNSYDVIGMLEALRQHDQFTRTLEKKYGNLLPPGTSKP